MGFEPMTPCLPGRCSPSWATPPDWFLGFCFFSIQPSRSEDFTFRLVEKFHSFTNFTFDAVKNFIASDACLVGPSGLEPPTSCLSGTRSNLLSYEPLWFTLGFLIFDEGKLVSFVDVSTELSSRTVSRKVFSPLQSLTSVFGMGTGGPSAFVALTISQ